MTNKEQKIAELKETLRKAKTNKVKRTLLEKIRALENDKTILK